LALYLVLRMRTQLIPERFRIKNIKLAMRTTLALWTVLVLLGVGIYGERYVFTRTETSAPLLQMRQLGADLYVHAVELDDAAGFSLAAVRRHAEHLVNLIEGSSGPDYGDGDGNGRLEDPGDGVGLRARLEAVAAAAPGDATAADATAAEADLDRIVALALPLEHIQGIEGASGPADEVLTLARRTNGGSVEHLDIAARATGVLEEPMVLVAVAAGSVAPDTAAVHESGIQYAPKVLTVPVGTTVEWVNDEVPKHTVTADDRSFDSDTQSQGDTFSHTFTTPGTWLYYCRFHGDAGGLGMSGTIIVH
jgi:plastocyanin